jgi:DUF971 family protein
MGLLDRISSPPRLTAPPERIDLSDAGALVVTWEDGTRSTIAAFDLRDQCPCAGCIEEGSGRKILDPATIPADIRPVELKAVGNYAIQIRWSDGHATGIYSWAALRRAAGLQGG